MATDNNKTATEPKMNIEEYLTQFGVIGKEDLLNCEKMSQMLYSAILNKFRVTMSREEYYYFREYQERVFDLVENLRELSSETIPLVLDFLDKNDHYLVDIIIMLWCVPRTGTFVSKNSYNNKYKSNIQNYSWKMVKNIDHLSMKNFCIETITKTNSVPVHCIDYLWFYMNTVSLELAFYNSQNSGYITFVMSEDEFAEFGFNMEYLLEMGLGQVVYSNDPGQKGSFRNFLKKIITNEDVVKKLLTTKYKDNFRSQMLSIVKNPKKYLGEDASSFPEKIIL